MPTFYFQSDCQFLTAHHCTNSQNSIISFEYVDFLAKIILGFYPSLENSTTRITITDKDLGVKCSFCESVFPKESALQDHIELLHVMKKCPICGESVETMKKLEKHMAEFHEGVKPYQCTECDAAFSYQRTLKNHIGMVHEGKRPHLCPHCGVSFQTTNALTRHVDRIHEKKKPFKCLMCNYSFAGKGDLKKHILRMHAGKSKPAKNFNCEYCDVKFAQKANLKIHIASVHEGKRHKCSICDKTYATKAILETHVATVHEKSDAFKCTICEATFTTKGTLKYHTQNIHEKPESKANPENYEINHVELGGHFMSESTPNIPLLPMLDVHKTAITNGHITDGPDKGQLISKCPFGFFKSTKKPKKFL